VTRCGCGRLDGQRLAGAEAHLLLRLLHERCAGSPSAGRTCPDVAVVVPRHFLLLRDLQLGRSESRARCHARHGARLHTGGSRS
jgi:hypothetical protein